MFNPPLTPTMQTQPPIESSSPSGAFVSVFTPTAQSQLPGTEEIDINGIKVGEWASDLRACDWKSPYYWMVSCCPCFPVAQLEVRLGWSTYGRALLRHAFNYFVFAFIFVANIVTIIQLFRGERAFWTEILLLVCLLATSVILSRRIGHMRSEVRTRFHIQGSEKEDQRVALLHTSRAIRQLGKHLQCDRAVFSRAPTTLQAYQV